jgi:sortase (surface protein transpeptidase)
MKHNEFTFFEKLSLGDRFYFPTDKAKVAYQVIAPGLYNQVLDDGRKTLMHDKPAARDKPVIFLRHTLPQPGQPCRLHDLKKGDIFFFPDNVVLEYEITESSNTHYVIRSVNDKGIGFEKVDCEVVFVRKVNTL